MAIESLDQLIAGLSRSQDLRIFKTPVTATAGRYASLWTLGTLPAPGSTPPAGSGEAPTKNTPGAFSFTNPAPGEKSYLGAASGAGHLAGSLIVLDRLVHTSGLVGNSAAVQAVNTVPLPARAPAGGPGTIWLEWYTSTGATSVNASASYTNQDGVAGRTTPLISLGATRRVAEMIPLPLQSGDSGVLSVQSVTLSASTGTAGNFGVTLARRIAEIPMVLGNTGFTLDALDLGMPEIADDACLMMAWLVAGTATPWLLGSMNLIQG